MMEAAAIGVLVAGVRTGPDEEAATPDRLRHTAAACPSFLRVVLARHLDPVPLS